MYAVFAVVLHNSALQSFALWPKLGGITPTVALPSRSPRRSPPPQRAYIHAGYIPIGVNLYLESESFLFLPVGQQRARHCGCAPGNRHGCVVTSQVSRAQTAVFSPLDRRRDAFPMQTSWLICCPTAALSYRTDCQRCLQLCCMIGALQNKCLAPLFTARIRTARDRILAFCFDPGADQCAPGVDLGAARDSLQTY